MDLEIVQALIVVPMVMAEGGLFYLLARKFWKVSRQEATLMAIGLTLSFCAAVTVALRFIAGAGRGGMKPFPVPI